MGADSTVADDEVTRGIEIYCLSLRTAQFVVAWHKEKSDPPRCEASRQRSTDTKASEVHTHSFASAYDVDNEGRASPQMETCGGTRAAREDEARIPMSGRRKMSRDKGHKRPVEDAAESVNASADVPVVADTDASWRRRAPSRAQCGDESGADDDGPGWQSWVFAQHQQLPRLSEKSPRAALHQAYWRNGDS